MTHKEASAETSPPSRRGHPRFYEILEELGKTHELKNTGYAKPEDPLSNFKMCEQFKCPTCKTPIPAWLGALIRASDKWSRLVQLAGDPTNDKVSESIEDTLTDLAGYSLIIRVLREGQKK